MAASALVVPTITRSQYGDRCGGGGGGGRMTPRRSLQSPPEERSLQQRQTSSASKDVDADPFRSRSSLSAAVQLATASTNHSRCSLSPGDVFTARGLPSGSPSSSCRSSNCSTGNNNRRRRTVAGLTTVDDGGGVEVVVDSTAAVAASLLLQQFHQQQQHQQQLTLEQRNVRRTRIIRTSYNVDGLNARSGGQSRNRQQPIQSTFHLFVVVKITIFCRRLSVSRNLFRHNPLYERIEPYFNSVEFVVESQGTGNCFTYCANGAVELMFDRNKYKADRRLLVAEDAKRILQKHEWQRTEKDVEYIRRAMRDVKAFAELPVRMQCKLAEVGRYESYEMKRVILMQGDVARWFYFILSGSVVVLVTDDDSSITRLVATMRRGITFGELAIHNRSRRRSTIVARENVELLSIDVEDYHRIFMLGGIKSIADQDHQQFLRSLSFLNGWPIEKIMTDVSKKQCIFHYFKRDEIIVRDSCHSSWILIVKSGSLKVLKKLQRVSPEDAKKLRIKSSRQRRKQILHKLTHGKPTVDNSLANHLWNFPPPTSRNSRQTSRSLCTHLCSPSCRAGANNNRLARCLVGGLSPSFAVGSRSVGSGVMLVTGQAHRGCAATDVDPPPFRPSTENDTDDVFTTSPPPTKSVTATGPKSTGRRPQMRKQDGASRAQLLERTKSFRHVYQRTTSLAGRKQTNSNLQDRMETCTSETELAGIRTVAKDLDTSLRDNEADVLTEADVNPQFVQVQILSRGHVFGLSDLLLSDQPSLSVVSSGAECILLDKQFYLDNAPESLINRVRLHECCPYPSDTEMQQKLLQTVQWAEFRRATLDDVINRRWKKNILNLTSLNVTITTCCSH